MTIISENSDLVKQIKDRWPLESMLARLNINIPKKRKFKSPFRPDNHPSCEIFDETIRDRSTGESFDSIECFALVNGIGNSEAIRRLAAELPGREAHQPRPAAKRKELVIPKLSYSPEKAGALAKLRGVTREGVDFAATSMGALGFAQVLGFDCWILTDGKTIAEARRMDGEKFPSIGNLGERKSHTLAGSSKSSPIGIRPQYGAKALKKLPLLLVEGGPDYLAACSILWDHERYQPAAMLGSGQAIHADALPHFRERQVLILSHDDDAGVQGAKKWARQLAQEGATPRIRKMVGGDLNDLLVARGAATVIKELLS